MARKEMTGRVMSNKMQKTVVVQVETLRQHPRYRRMVRHRAKFYAHDAESACSPGDVVRIQETRPLSKTKHWRVVAVLQKGAVPELKPVEIDQTLLEPPAATEPAEKKE